MSLIAVPESLASRPGIGRVVWPSWSNVSATDLARAWRDADLPADLAPADPSPLAALRAAMGSVSSMRRLVRPLPSGEGYGIVSETADGDRALSHTFDLAVWLESNGGGTILRRFPEDHPLAATVLAAYADADAYPREKLSAWFSQRIVPALSGVALRPMGGIWWIPPAQVETLDRIATTLRGVGAGKVYGMPATDDASTLVESVLDGIAAETEKAAADAEGLLSDESATARKYRGEMKRLASFASKLDAWSAALAVPLDTMREKITEVQASVVMAEGIAQGKEDAERAAKKR